MDASVHNQGFVCYSFHIFRYFFRQYIQHFLVFFWSSSSTVFLLNSTIFFNLLTSILTFFVFVIVILKFLLINLNKLSSHFSNFYYNVSRINIVNFLPLHRDTYVPFLNLFYAYIYYIYIYIYIYISFVHMLNREVLPL